MQKRCFICAQDFVKHNNNNNINNSNIWSYERKFISRTNKNTIVIDWKNEKIFKLNGTFLI